MTFNISDSDKQGGICNSASAQGRIANNRAGNPEPPPGLGKRNARRKFMSEIDELLAAKFLHRP
ncbi:MAG: hypothetical protein QOG67_2169, partial [Verrucomicrobiota bacterium]